MKKRFAFRILPVVLLLLCTLIFGTAPASAAGPTYVSGVITADTTWTLSGSPYIVTGYTYVSGTAGPDGVTTLTIEPGVVVRFDGNYDLRIGDGSQPGRLIADGTPGDPITFTSNKSTPAKGNWGSIHFESTKFTGGVIDHAIVEYGGGNPSTLCNIYLYGASPTISNSIIRNSSGYGVRVATNSAPGMSANQFTGNGRYPVWFENGPAYAGCVGENNTASGNGLGDTVYVSGGAVATNFAWADAGIPYQPSSSIYVNGGATFTVNPGVEVRFSAGGDQLEIGQDGSTGRLVAQGEPDNLITFTSIGQTPGSWRGIILNRCLAGTILENAIVEYGGAGYGVNGNAVYPNVGVIGTGNPTITRCIIRNSHTGIYCGNYYTEPEATVTCNQITANSYGVYCSQGGNPTINYNNISGNTAYGVYNVFDDYHPVIVDAKYNWWGASDGPSGGGGTGDKVSSYVYYDPYLGGGGGGRLRASLSWAPSC